MADGLTVLADALSPSSSGEFIQKLRTDDAVRLGLNTFCSVLRSGVQSSDDGTSRFLSWTDAQIHGISSFVYAIASASRSLSGIIFCAISHELDFLSCFAVLRFDLCDRCCCCASVFLFLDKT